MYQYTDWKDHVTLPANCFKITDNGDGTVTITPAGTVMQQGTPQDQTHFGNLEKGMLDAHTAALLLLNFARQNAWEVERGTKHLTNDAKYPFNSSQSSVALSLGRENGDYIVLTEVVETDGNVGEVVVSGKLTNGFKMAFTGSATTATINYIVIGGLLR